MTDKEFQQGLDNIKVITDDIATAVKDADLMIEALPESLELKERFYEEVSELALIKQSLLAIPLHSSLAN